MVQSADSAPLGDKELDNQGRCVVTDHGKFVVFNVYVPCGGGAETLPRKMKFLNALHDAMDRQRKGGKHVMLVGDYNIKIDKRDLYWKNLSLNVDEILEQVNVGEGGENNPYVAPWKKDIAKHWAEIERVLQTIEVSQINAPHACTTLCSHYLISFCHRQYRARQRIHRRGKLSIASVHV